MYSSSIIEYIILSEHVSFVVCRMSE